ncbi:MAG TPA: oligosaccharide flippase family protein [Terriglobales bacterium]|jgi:O-antigen/teichoic acid export membrane protein|nr:oligosaccharide flippase family protein [Terriglobales bacterium]
MSEEQPRGEQSPAEVELAELAGGGGAVAEPDLGAMAARLMRGSALYALANFGIKALNFFLLPLYTRFLSPADYGTISLAETIAAVAATLFGMGLEPGVRRLYFQYVEDSGELARYLSSVLRFAVLVTGAVVTLVFLTGPAFLRWVDPHFAVPFYPYVALAVGAAALSQFVQYRLGLYQAEARPKAYGLLSLVFFLATAGSAIALVVFVRWGAYGMLLGKLVAAAALALVSFGLLGRWLRHALAWRYVRETLPLSLPLVPHGLMALGLVAADRFILERYRSLDEVGLYSLAYTLGMVMFLVTLSIAQAWQTIFFDTARTGDASGRRMLGQLSSGLALLLSGIAMLGALLAPDFVRLLDPRYLPAGRLIPWVIGGYLFHAFFGLFQLSALQGKRTQFILFASLVAFAVNLALNLWWIPIWGMYGAAYATTAAYALEAVLMYIYAQRIFPLPYDRWRMLAALAVFGGALALTQRAWPLSLRPWVMLAALAAGWGLLRLVGGATLVQTIRLAFRRTSSA